MGVLVYIASAIVGLYISFLFCGYCLCWLFCHYYSRKSILITHEGNENCIDKQNLSDQKQSQSMTGNPNKWRQILINGFVYGLIHYFCLRVGRMPSFSFRSFLYKHVFCMKISKHTIIYGGCEFRSPWNISIGNSVIGANNVLDGRGGILIKDNVCTSSQVNIWTMQHNPQDAHFGVKTGMVIINDYAWVSSKSTILPGRIIDKGAVIANSAVVTNNCDAYGIYAGVPAKKIGERNDDLQYSLNTHWWFI